MNETIQATDARFESAQARKENLGRALYMDKKANGNGSQRKELEQNL